METNPDAAKIAYFSMEIALTPDMPTYAGGLGILAGDTLRAAADFGVPMVAVTLLHRAGYFEQHLDKQGRQSEQPSTWEPQERLEPLEPVVKVEIAGRPVKIRAWQYSVLGIAGQNVPVYLLDTFVEDNDDWGRGLTNQLYGGDPRYRLAQEMVLGIGGIRMLQALGLTEIDKYHMNEGHSALLVLEVAASGSEGRSVQTITSADVDGVRPKCIFTTHTPVPAGHDRFPMALTREVLGEQWASALETSDCCHDGELNMTYLGLRGSSFINGVAMQHGEISKGMFPGYPVSAITNGVHTSTWTSAPFGELFDRHISAWRRDPNYLRYARGIPVAEIREAHLAAKRELITAIQGTTGVQLDENVMTLGFARRATAYKRADLLFTNVERLRWIARHVGRLQLIFGGKAHPRDGQGKQLIEFIFGAATALQGDVPTVYVPNYDMHWGQLLTSGVDLWLNTPQIPREASGTSGMKAALNGVPSLSVLDGWWVEGHLEGITGWSIGHGRDFPEDAGTEAASLYEKLESVILPMFYGRPAAYGEVMRSAIAINGSFFTTRRMLFQYLINAYFPDLTVRGLLNNWRETGVLAG